ncbi:MAG: 3-dehydroquinate synthase [Bacteroidales bacterium]|nr:3-dehydroquinate synthase [Bacteroidales bacterium]
MLTLKTKDYKVLIGDSLDAFNLYLSSISDTVSKAFILVDENTKKYCLPLFENHLRHFKNCIILEIESGEGNKNLTNCCKIWDGLHHNNADRKSILMNLGGGVVCDMGAFAASTFKRGLRYINVPTSLLSMADASIGGKTGFNMHGLKNQIGLFSNPELVFIYKSFLKTLPDTEMKSGYAEMLKHALLDSNAHWKKIISTHKNNLGELIFDTLAFKLSIVESDPLEKCERKSLNLGHTIGHAIEMLGEKMNNQNLKHGEAVAVGLICAIGLSESIEGFSLDKRNEIVSFIKNHFTFFPVKKEYYEEVFELMCHDKKNSSNKIKMVLLSSIGHVKIDCEVSKSDVFKALDFYNTLYQS